MIKFNLYTLTLTVPNQSSSLQLLVILTVSFFSCIPNQPITEPTLAELAPVPGQSGAWQ